MMRVLPLLKSRPVATGILLSMAAVGIASLARVVIQVEGVFARQQQSIQQSLNRFARYRAQAELRPDLEARLAQANGIAASLPGLMKADNASAAADRLQGDLKAIVQKGRGEIRAMRPAAPSEVDGFERISVASSFSLPITSLRDVVYSVEAHTPYYFIQQMTITGPHDWPADLKNAPEPKLQIDWTVYALRRSDTQ